MTSVAKGPSRASSACLSRRRYPVSALGRSDTAPPSLGALPGSGCRTDTPAQYPPAASDQTISYKGPQIAATVASHGVGLPGIASINAAGPCQIGLRSMLSTLPVVLPIFALILAGWLARRISVLGPGAASELSRFVVHLALPALLFDIVARAGWTEIWQPGFIGAFGLGAALVFAATIVLRRRARPLADAAIDGLNAAYANTGFLGFPLVFAALGQEAMGPTLVATIITVCVLFAIAIILIEASLQAETRPLPLLRKVGGSLLRNPLLAAPVLGGLLPLLGLSLPAPAETFLRLLGGAAPPCALVALGLFLAERRKVAAHEPRSVMLLVGLKLLVQPALTWALAKAVFGLPPSLVHAAVLLAALPTGTGPFMLAELYRREAGLTSGVLLASTVASVLTISGYLALID